MTKIPPFGKRVAVIGRGGKTGLAKAIGVQYALPFLELDSVVWLPGWKPRDRAERRGIIEKWIDDHPGGWTIDGETVDTTGRQAISRADVVILLDLPFRTVFGRVVVRSIRRIRSHEQVCGDNFESWRNSFLSKNSLIFLHLIWLVNGRWRRQRQRLVTLFTNLDSEQSSFHVRSARELDLFYEKYGLTPPNS